MTVIVSKLPYQKQQSYNKVTSDFSQKDIYLNYWLVDLIVYWFCIACQLILLNLFFL